jgi:tetratricopeptide (TPR) repeat protein
VIKLVAKSIVFIVVLAIFWSACQQAEPKSHCLLEDLGRYQFVKSESDQSNQGCWAEYRDLKGNKALVTLDSKNPKLFGQAQKTTKFEKHFVDYRRIDKGVEVGWHHGQIGIVVRLENVSVPQGPVLRAYLYQYPSSLAARIEKVESQVDQLKEHSKLQPKNARTHLELARKYRQLNKNVLATHEYHFSIDLDPGCFDCFYELGDLYLELRHWDLSIRALRKAIALEPKNPSGHRLLGDVFYKVRNGPQALSAYQKAAELDLAGTHRQKVEKRIAELKSGKYSDTKTGQ